MLSSRSLAVATTATRLLLADPAPIVATIVTPLLFTAFLIPATRAQLRMAGLAHATGGEQLVPGTAVMFAFFGLSLVASLFYREYAWGTWDRLRASSATSLDIVIGKIAPLYACLLAQMVLLFVAGSWLFGYHPNGSIFALALVIAVFVGMLVTFGVMLFSVFSTMDQAMIIGNIGGMLMAGIGGALAPASELPGWAQGLAHVTPAYWALRAIRDVTLDHAGIGDVLRPTVILCGFTVGFACVAGLRFRASDAKVGTT